MDIDWEFRGRKNGKKYKQNVGLKEISGRLICKNFPIPSVKRFVILSVIDLRRQNILFDVSIIV